jgi:hypothetical protein
MTWLVKVFPCRASLQALAKMVAFKMPKYQQKVTRHIEKQRNMSQDMSKKQTKSPEIGPKEVQSSNLLDNDF